MTDALGASPQEKIRPARPAFHWPSFLVVLLAAFGVLGAIGIAGASLVGGFMSLLDPSSYVYDTASVFAYMIGGLLACILLLPPLIFGIQRLSGKSPVTSKLLSGLLDKVPLWVLLVVYPIVIGTGWLLVHFEVLIWLTMPLVHVLALELPVLIILKLSLRKLDGGSIQRTWSAFAVSMIFNTLLVLVIEVIAMITGFILFSFVGSALFPDQFEPIIDIFSRLSTSDPTQIEYLMEDILKNPVVAIVLFGLFSVFVPVVEELLKPMAVWLSGRRLLTPQQGWFIGILGGAGFAFLENMGNVSITEDWAFSVIARFGATILHMFNTGLIGYTYALARKEKRYLRLLLAVLTAFVIHGLWNGVAVFASSSQAGYMIGLGSIAVILVVSLVRINKKLQPAAVSELPEIDFESEIE